MYLYGTKQCHFSHGHFISVAIGKQLADVRGFVYPSEIDMIIAYAMFELKDDWTNWGPYELKRTNESNKQLLRLFMDGQTVMDAEVEKEKITILYLKDFGGNLIWINEIADLAEAHWRSNNKEDQCH